MKKKTHKITLEFDSKESLDNFRAYWLDGGGDGGGNIDWHTDNWSDDYIRIEGTGYSFDEEGNLETPEFMQKRYEMIKNKYGWK